MASWFLTMVVCVEHGNWWSIMVVQGQPRLTVVSFVWGLNQSINHSKPFCRCWWIWKMSQICRRLVCKSGRHLCRLTLTVLSYYVLMDALKRAACDLVDQKMDVLTLWNCWQISTLLLQTCSNYIYRILAVIHAPPIISASSCLGLVWLSNLV